MDKSILSSGEAAVFKLRALYKKYGFLPFKMSKFEEYDLYVKNKDFLVGNGVITFMDTNGDLLALKPDVTLSIIKNTADKEGSVKKVYYDENVYRISGGTNRFKEIMQTGIECIGDIDVYSLYEVLLLAAKSLSEISENFLIDISHMGILKAFLDDATDEPSVKATLTDLIAQKNKHELSALCKNSGIPPSKEDALAALIDIHGEPFSVIEKLRPMCSGSAAEALDELSQTVSLLASCELYESFNLDFSVVNNMSYYDGIVFKGFISGLSEGVLAGGEYGALLRTMGRDADAVGFAIYLDMLEDLGYISESYDVDVLLLYGNDTTYKDVSAKCDELISQGMSVSAQRAIPEKLKYRELIKL